MSNFNDMEGRFFEEWKVAMENARHFNDLLMRLRTLGLPMVISIVGVGIGLLGANLKFEVPKAWIDLMGISIGVLILAYVYFAIRDSEKHKNDKFAVRMYGWEYISWCIAALEFFGLFLYALILDTHSNEGFFAYRSYYVGTFIMMAGLSLLGALYLLDRFYYYKLLIGAIKRTTEIENILTPPFHLTERTSQFIPTDRSTRLITYFYWVPGIVTLSVALILMLFI